MILDAKQRIDDGCICGDVRDAWMFGGGVCVCVWCICVDADFDGLQMNDAVFLRVLFEFSLTSNVFDFIESLSSPF